MCNTNNNCGCNPCTCGCDDQATFDARYLYYYDQLALLAGGKFTFGLGLPGAQFPAIDTANYIGYIDISTGSFYRWNTGTLVWDFFSTLPAPPPVAPLTFDNGLTRTLDNIQFGGILLDDTELNLDNFDLEINASTVNGEASYTFSQYNCYLYQSDPFSNTASNLLIEGPRAQLRSQASGTNTTKSILFRVNNGIGISILDDNENIGMRYLGNYAANNAANPRWIPDKAYVDSVAGGATASNGLTAVGSDIQLGGILTDDVAIDIDAFDFNINNFDGVASDLLELDLINVTGNKNISLGFYNSANSTSSFLAFSPLTYQSYVRNNVDGTILRQDFDSLRLLREISGANSGFSINDASIAAGAHITVLDSINNIGMRYNANYAGNNTGVNYNGLWIPAQQDVIQVRQVFDSVQTAAFNITGYGKALNFGVTELATPALNIDFTDAGVQYKTINVNSVFTFSNAAGGRSVQIAITNTAAGASTVAFTGGVMPAGTVLSIAPGVTHLYSFIQINGAIRGSQIIY